MPTMGVFSDVASASHPPTAAMSTEKADQRCKKAIGGKQEKTVDEPPWSIEVLKLP
jgi:hypothetical protein